MNKIYEHLSKFTDYYSLNSFMTQNGYSGLFNDVENLAWLNRRQVKEGKRETKRDIQLLMLEWWNANSNEHGDRNLTYYVDEGLKNYRLEFIGLMAIKDDYNRKQEIEKNN